LEAFDLLHTQQSVQTTICYHYNFV
jgi:hypothetical protein